MGQQALAMEAMEQDAQFGELLERHRGIVFKVANTYCRDPHDRADLAQEIATQLWRSFPRYDGTRTFSTWMYRIALNVAISFRRSGGHHEQHLVPFDAQLHDVAANGTEESDERVHALYRCIDALDPLTRAALPSPHRSSAASTRRTWQCCCCIWRNAAIARSQTFWV